MRRRTLGVGIAGSAVALVAATIASFAVTDTSSSNAQPVPTPHRSSASLKESVSALSAPRREDDALPPAFAAALRDTIASAGPDVPRELIPGEPRLNESRLLFADVGPHDARLYAVPTATGEVCLVFSGGLTGCADSHSFAHQPVSWSLFDPDGLGSGEPFTLYGIAPDTVDGVEIAADGVLHRALLRNNAFYYRLADMRALPQKIVVRFGDGTSETIDLPDYSKL